MYCRKCGTQNPDTSNFCSKCGERLSNTEKDERGSGDADHNQMPVLKTEGRQGKQRNIVVMIGAAIAVLAVGIIVFIVCVLKSGQIEADPVMATRMAASVTAESTASGQEAVAAEERTSVEGSARNDGNLCGNTHCYARMVSDGITLYFRNPLDSEKVYYTGEGKEKPIPFSDMYMKDMHHVGDYIYYCRTSKGDISGTEPDRNIYRVKLDGTGTQKLTDISYGDKEAWLSLDTVVDGKCYFTYSDGIQDGYHIGEASCDGTGYQDLYFINPENCNGIPALNIVAQKIYYKAKDGLNCLDMVTGTNNLAIPGFDCDEFIIYGGDIYFNMNADQQGKAARIGKVGLDGNDYEVLFAPSENWVREIRINIYKDKLYFIGLSEDPSAEAKGIVYVSNLDGSERKTLVEKATWFNIVNDRLYYRYSYNNNVKADREEPIYSFDLSDAGKMAKASDMEIRQLFDTEDFNYFRWVQVGDDWYYYMFGDMVQAGSKAHVSWCVIDDNYYCFGEDGKLFVNTITPDGYQVNENGCVVWDRENITGIYVADSQFKDPAYAVDAVSHGVEIRHYMDDNYFIQEWADTGDRFYYGEMYQFTYEPGVRYYSANNCIKSGDILMYYSGILSFSFEGYEGLRISVTNDSACANPSAWNGSYTKQTE